MLDPAQTETLARALGDSPETVISLHLLRRGLGRAWVAGTPASPRAVVVEPLAFDLGEPMAFGTDPAEIWTLLAEIDDWWCVNVAPGVANDLAARIEDTTSRPVAFEDDIYLTLRHAPSVSIHPCVRRLASIDLPLLLSASAGFEPSGFAGWEELIAESVAAGAIANGKMVSLAYVSAASPGHANLTIATLPAHRRRGFATSCAALVVGAIVAAGGIAVWSAGASNAASLAVARRLGFAEVKRRVYLVLGDDACREMERTNPPPRSGGLSALDADIGHCTILP
ncbi:MAG: GNAT family N-acetyltransferase [Chloroflexia bacterium]|nr:GNAT family N-acetyltransferase [Chloroflexia bacterium]